MTFMNNATMDGQHSLEISETAVSFETFLHVPAKQLAAYNRLTLAFRGEGAINYVLGVLTPNATMQIQLGESAALASVYTNCCPTDGDSTLWGASSFCNR
jgi:hypothetical protein